jgi:hypothetical protein
MIQAAFTTLFRRKEFKGKGDRGGGGEGEMSMLGSHSIQKYPSTFARRCGVTKDEKDIRGRWKGAGKGSTNVNDDVELPYPDAKVAEKLWWWPLLLCVKPRTQRRDDDEHFCSKLRLSEYQEASP